MKNLQKSLMLGTILVAGISTSAHATRITTLNLANTTTAGSALVSNINATPSAIIRLDVGGANFTSTSTPLTLSITVDTSTPVVTTGLAADQAFKDDAIGAAYFGYYLSVGERSSNQSGATAVNVKVKKGSAESSGRSYYLLGNAVTIPSVQGDLTVAPASATTFATGAANGVHCGPSYSANGLSGAIGCAGGSTVANMDITQFVKVLYSDPTSAAIISSLEFTAVYE